MAQADASWFGFGAEAPAFGRAPAVVRVAAGGGALELEDSEGAGEVASVAAPAERLRLACRCAWCTRARIDGSFPDRFEAVAITHVELIGGYAVRLHFSDGHDRGIFPWSFIRHIAAAEAPQLSPAPETEPCLS
jgi:DUF971 family protein